MTDVTDIDGNVISRKRGKWQPGFSGNPQGKPKDKQQSKNFGKLIKQELRKKPKGLKISNYLVIIRKAIAQAIEGDRYAREWLSTRSEGKPPEFIYQGELDKEQLKVIE